MVHARFLRKRCNLRKRALVGIELPRPTEKQWQVLHLAHKLTAEEQSTQAQTLWPPSRGQKLQGCVAIATYDVSRTIRTASDAVEKISAAEIPVGVFAVLQTTFTSTEVSLLETFAKRIVVEKGRATTVRDATVRVATRQFFAAKPPNSSSLRLAEPGDLWVAPDGIWVLCLPLAWMVWENGTEFKHPVVPDRVLGYQARTRIMAYGSRPAVTNFGAQWAWEGAATAASLGLPELLDDEGHPKELNMLSSRHIAKILEAVLGIDPANLPANSPPADVESEAAPFPTAHSPAPDRFLAPERSEVPPVPERSPAPERSPVPERSSVPEQSPGCGSIRWFTGTSMTLPAYIEDTEVRHPLSPAHAGIHIKPRIPMQSWRGGSLREKMQRRCLTVRYRETPWPLS